MNQLFHPKIFLRTTLLFFSANALNLSLHEFCHAITAFFLKVPSTLFHFYVNINRNETSEPDQAIIAITGPVCSLFIGVLSWIFYKKRITGISRLFLLYAAMVGISIFFGNLFSTAFVGDFGRVSQILHFPQNLRYFISALGLAGLISFMFISGKEFLNIGLFETPRSRLAILNGLLVPWLLGTGLVILAYAPLPRQFVIGIITSSVFWIFSLIGAVTSKPSTNTVHFSKFVLTSIDVVLFFISLVVVRILVPGIHFSV